jgi:hypothetical protein
VYVHVRGAEETSKRIGKKSFRSAVKFRHQGMTATSQNEIHVIN